MLVIIYFGVGSIVEFNLYIVFIFILFFFDYLVEIIFEFYLYKLLVDGYMEGLLVYWGYCLLI